MKIWAKIYLGDRLQKNVLYESAHTCTQANFLKDIQEICYKMDISTPVCLSSHYTNFVRFNRVKFLPRDFIESVDFTSFVLENVLEKK